MWPPPGRGCVGTQASLVNVELRAEVRHSRIFLDTPERTARRALQRGGTLHNLVVERVGVVAGTASRSERRRDSGGRERRPQKNGGRRPSTVGADLRGPLERSRAATASPSRRSRRARRTGC